ncbi:MAG: response regulator [Treponema sp.]|nr:response regulator [Treponema sp.]
MQFSKESFTDDYAAEMNEHLDAITNSIINLKSSPKNNSTVSEILRDLHTIKGSSRMLDYLTIEKLSHGLEDVYKSILEEHFDFNDSISRLSYAVIEKIRKLLSKIKKDHDDTEDVSIFMEALEKASRGLFFNAQILESINDGSFNLQDEDENEDETLENIKSIRIGIERINEIIRTFDNLIIRQFRFKHELENFEQKLKKADGRIKEIPNQLKEDLSLTETAVFETQNLILNLRMLPLNMVLTPLKREIEKDSITLNKNIKFDIPETDFMLDKVILEQLKEILMHLVRNSIDHGIESPEERIEKGKDRDGLISITAVQASSHIIITVSDDGRGIQYDRVRKYAENKFPEQKDSISLMDEKELQRYLFFPGFTTTEKADNLSGRGIGLDIVQNGMKKIKGKVQVVSKKDEGTSFRLTIPLSLATQQGLFITTGGMRFMIPSHYIHEITDGESQNILVMQGQNFISVHNQYIPVYNLSTILGNQKSENENSVIVLEYLETQMAIFVKSIEHYENVVVTSLPAIMKKMSSLQGVVYDENYSIIPILNIPEIMQRMRTLLTYDIKKYKAKNEKKTYTVLIADDSVTTRQIEESIFESDGYIVKTAADGIEALEILKEFHIDLIVSDVDMPRMDGLILLSNIRRMEEYSQLPVIIVTGAYSEKDEKRFIDAGAQKFILKSQFQRGNLLNAAKELLGE